MDADNVGHGDESTEDYDLADFFTNEDYFEKIFTFSDSISLSLLCSSSSSTSHDLTGQIIWPASILLGHFIASNREIFKDKCVLELGAGCGLAGYLAAQFSKHVVITDGNVVVLRLLQRNKELHDAKQHQDINQGRIDVNRLLWGMRSEIDSIYDHVEAPDIIIGADVILWPNFTAALLQTIKKLLSFKPSSSICYISYIVRATTTTDLLYSLAASYGLIIESVEINSFLADPMPVSLATLEKRLLSIKLMDTNISSMDDPFKEDITAQYQSSSAPC